MWGWIKKTAKKIWREIGHTCGLWHSKTSDNLMFESSPAGENVKGFQKNILRSSRHVMYW